LVAQEKINEAYELAFVKIYNEGEDESILIKLMSRTGVCVDILSKENLNKIINSICGFLNLKSNIEAVLPWI